MDEPERRATFVGHPDAPPEPVQKPEEIYAAGKDDGREYRDPRKLDGRKEQMTYSAGYYAGISQRFGSSGCGGPLSEDVPTFDV